MTTPKPTTAPDETAARLRALEWVTEAQRLSRAMMLPDGRMPDDGALGTIEAALKAAPPPEALTPEEWNKVRGIFALAEAHNIECTDLYARLRRLRPVVDTEGK